MGTTHPTQLKIIATVTADVLSGTRDQTSQAHLDAATVQSLLLRVPDLGMRHVRGLSPPSEPERRPKGAQLAVGESSRHRAKEARRPGPRA
jgi:hypothetical protein